MNVSSMTSPSETLRTSPGSASSPPAWVNELLSNSDADRDTCLRTVTIAAADEMDDRSLEAAVTASYAAIFDELQADAPWHPVRFWNFLPALRQRSAGGRDRYHVFNAGRFVAFERQYGGRAQFTRSVATATAVGSADRDLIIHCLARRKPGMPINNPSQVRPYQYSQRYGHLPPCFARGTLIDGATLLVGGTASIVGEDSLHRDDLIAQTQRTLVNLSSLVTASGLATENLATESLATESLAAAGLAKDRPLETFRSLRVYHSREGDREQLMGLLGESFPNVGQIEFVTAEICRAELLVEIEGVAGEVLA